MAPKPRTGAYTKALFRQVQAFVNADHLKAACCQTARIEEGGLICLPYAGLREVAGIDAKTELLNKVFTAIDLRKGQPRPSDWVVRLDGLRAPDGLEQLTNDAWRQAILSAVRSGLREVGLACAAHRIRSRMGGGGGAAPAPLLPST
jgi:hypothetical protein